MKQKRIFFSIVLLMFILAGCSQSLGEAQVEFCQALNSYRGAVVELSDINAGTTVDELNQARENIAKSRDELLNSADSLHNARLRYTEDAFADLEEELADIPGEATLGEAANKTRLEVATLLTEIDRIYNINCSRR